MNTSRIIIEEFFFHFFYEWNTCTGIWRYCFQIQDHLILVLKLGNYLSNVTFLVLWECKW